MATQTRADAKLSRTRSVAALRVREHTEELEDANLAEHATRSATARRDRPEEPSPTRAAFALDRDRIVHSKAFRRLKHKTQVFLAPVGDHYRTRLTHTLEVTQIGRSIARALRLNEDLVEAMAMGHDVGHTPFGHIGEELLGRFLPDGFRHNEQSVRIVEKIEKNGAGLNLTREVRDGIAKHSAPTEGGVETAAWGIPETPEGWVVRYADKIAYLHHDIDDAMRAEIVREEDIPQDIRAALGRDRAERLDTMTYDVIVTSYGKRDVTMSDEVLEATNALRTFMFEHVYLAGPAKTEDRKAQGVLWELLQHFEAHPELLPPEHQKIARQDGTRRAVADYVAGMTDRYALDTFASIFIPSGWSHL
ncbi:MAG TPA: deoxyguanosinetriphosphate triphosphohydrolase [Candidatus Limnocylindria bacterium]|jgi:dGTPase|nr:deoxyguanosinetriphosphate triphosphohydrolase [Candidatus Limnocylindria bacterium]